MFQKKGIPRNSAELTGKQLCAGVSFITMKVQASWIKLNFTFKFYTAQVLSSEICEIFKNTLENTNNSVEHLRTRWQFFYGRKVHPLLYHFQKKV